MTASASTPAGPAPDIDALLADRGVPVLVDCFAPGCGPCAALAPVLDELQTEMAGQLAVVKVDVGAAPAIARRFGGTAARLGVRDRKRYFRACIPAEVEATWLGS